MQFKSSLNHGQWEWGGLHTIEKKKKEKKYILFNLSSGDYKNAKLHSDISIAIFLQNSLTEEAESFQHKYSSGSNDDSQVQTIKVWICEQTCALAQTEREMTSFTSAAHQWSTYTTLPEWTRGEDISQTMLE